MQGMLFVDKPAGWTSFDVVNYVRRMVAGIEGKKPKNIKVGHCGTLDPFATGLLILLVGKEYTRQAGSLTKQDKTYEATIALGSISSTGDPEGALTAVSDVIPAAEQVLGALERFKGEIQQTPPQFSAIKINGQKAYNLARKGVAVEIPVRTVTIYELELLGYEYPTIKIHTRVSSGTYIRSLAEDIGGVLGTGAYCNQLRRTSIAQWDISQAVTIEQLKSQPLESFLQVHLN
ncbi:MAG: tRNA pseudouridine(55) synthase TruB [Candidatus Saccharimonadales bacterium]